jgi:hypothetical protein
MLTTRTETTGHPLCQMQLTTISMLATNTKIAGRPQGPTRPTTRTTLAAETRTKTSGHPLCRTHPRDHGTRVLLVLLVILEGLEVSNKLEVVLQVAQQAMRTLRARCPMGLYSQQNRREREGQRRKRHSWVL